MMRKAALVAFLLFVLIGCSGEPTLDQESRQAVAAESAALLVATHSGDGPSVSIPRNLWPSTIRSLEPRDVRADAIGLYVPMGSFFVQEWGYFVPRNEAAFSPMVGGDPSYRTLGEGLYWYEIKG